MRLNICCTAFLLSLLRQRGFSLICVFHIFPAPFFPRAFVFQCFWQFLFQTKAVLGSSAFWVPFVCICSVLFLFLTLFSRLVVLFAVVCFSQGGKKAFCIVCWWQVLIWLEKQRLFCLLVAESEEMQESGREKATFKRNIGSVGEYRLLLFV